MHSSGVVVPNTVVVFKGTGVVVLACKLAYSAHRLQVIGHVAMAYSTLIGSKFAHRKVV